MRLFLRLFSLFLLAAAGVGWWLTRPATLPDGWEDDLTADPAAGQLVFAAGGCVSCHAAPDAQAAEGPPVLSGGKAFVSAFGTFYASNISPDPEAGIGGWTLREFATALTQGVSPEGSHYYPAFPYTSYRLMTPQDVANLYAYIQTLPADSTPTRAHDVAFPFSLRRSIGAWKTLYLPDGFTVASATSDVAKRGRYLAEALGHCAECHTPRTALGGLDRSQWMSGAPDPSGDGKIPGITRRHLEWSQADLVEYFTSGFTPEYDTVGGDMAEVVENLSNLPFEDREALAAYVVSLP